MKKIDVINNIAINTVVAVETPNTAVEINPNTIVRIGKVF